MYIPEGSYEFVPFAYMYASTLAAPARTALWT
eukprot:COSAG02_NODE_58290_length_278_cov_0.463687_1_plen_31_part_01